ncbi:MAG TPA: Crp/Fnr family transcriptional regulator [Puia sp.]|nr:Crp/Fnr family transcriptional regulator [Puia sp.]
MSVDKNILQRFSFLDTDLLYEISEISSVQEIPANTEVLREGQYIKVVPYVVEGLIKVFTRTEDKELLLYYIRPNESCIMSFAASRRNERSKVFAVTEEKTTVLLMPVDKINQWSKQYPNINNLFFHLYTQRYGDLLNTIHHLLFKRMDTRLHEYLKEKIALTNKNPIKMSHRQIANELGTAREVISRVLKKLEYENKVKQDENGIELLQW